jgi:acyl-CoA oxidase
MPPTAPCGYPTTAIVFARLFVRGLDYGIKTFIVPINDGTRMCKGVVSIQLHARGGSNPVPHAITSFHNVQLPLTALLGSPERAADQKAAFFRQIDRVVCGTLIMGGVAAMHLPMSTAIAASYFQRRHVSDPISRKPTPIIEFPNQSTFILLAIAQIHVLNAYGEHTRQRFGLCKLAVQRHFLAAVWKITAARMVMTSMQTLIDGCGAQGLFEVNQLTTILASISECIRESE